MAHEVFQIDGNQPSVVANESNPSPSGQHMIRLVLALLLFTLVGIAGYMLGGQRSLPVNNFPLDGSAEAGFARDMVRHHAQAVEMAVLLRDNSNDPALRLLAFDIMMTQQAQIGVMNGWLAIWGLNTGTTEPAMTWMDMPTTGAMPGMASQEELNRLREAKDMAADEQFLRLMIPHHRAGVVMAQALLDRSQHPQMRALAQSVVNSQQSEITYMQDLLKGMGLPKVPEDTQNEHEQMSH